MIDASLHPRRAISGPSRAVGPVRALPPSQPTGRKTRSAVARLDAAPAQPAKPAKPRSRVRRFGLKRVAVILAGTACVVPVIFSAPDSMAAPQSAIQNVSVQVAPNGSVTSLSSLVAVKDQSGTVTGKSTQLDPTTDGGQLPIRVSTAWWLNGQTGTNLGDLQGKSGTITIALTVDNLTLQSQEVTFDNDGAKYRQYALVGVPLTVAASAQLNNNTIGDIVTSADNLDSNATNGVPSQSSSGQTQVQWAAILAPPILSSSTTFRLTVQATNFTPPSFDISVQPGILTNTSAQQALAMANGANTTTAAREQSTLDVVTNVTEQLQQGQDLINQVYETLSQDASQLGSQTYSELQSSSAAILSQISSTKSRLNDLSSQAQSDTAAAQSGINSDLNALLTRLNTDVLGSTTDTLQFTTTPIAGCNINLPELPDGTPRTLASTVRLINEQLQTVVQAFSDQSTSQSTTAGTNCRSLLVQQLTTSIGSPTTNCAVDDSSVRCAISDARAQLQTNSQQLNALQTSLADQLNSLGVSQLAGQVQQLASDLTDLKQDMGSLSLSTTGASSTLTTTLTPLLATTLPAITSDVDQIRSTLTSLGSQTPSTVVGQPNFASVQQQLSSVSTNIGQLQQTISGQITGLSSYQKQLAGTLSSIDQQAQGISSDLSTSDPSSTGSQIDSLLDTLSQIQQAQPNSTSTSGGNQTQTTPPAGTVLPSNWQSQLNAILNPMITNNAKCPQNWTKISSPTGNANADYATALQALAADTDCPASTLAGVFAPLVSASVYQQTVQSLATTSTDPAAAKTQLANIATSSQNISTTATSFNQTGLWNSLTGNLATISQKLGGLNTSLGAAATSLTQLQSETASVLPLLDDLWSSDPTGKTAPTGLLATITNNLTTVQNLASTGKLQSAKSQLAGIIQELNNDFSGTVVPGAQCPATPAAVGTMPQASADSVIWMSNYLTCQKVAIDANLNSWFQSASLVYGSADTELANAITKSNTALNQATTSIGTLSDSLINQLNNTTGTIINENLATINTAEAENTQELAAITKDFTDSTNGVVTDLITQINAANTDADAAQAQLQQDFSAVFANLGSPDQSSRIGLLGKMRSAAATTGDTVSVLGNVTQSTSDQSSALSDQILNLKLQTALFQAAQDRTTDLPQFPGAPSGVDAFTVFSIHVSGR